MTTTPAIILKYRQIRKLAVQGATEGERASARAAMERLEAKYPEIAREIERIESQAKRKAQEEALRRAGYPAPPPFDVDTKAGWGSQLLQGILKRASEWAVQKLTEELPALSPEELERFMRKVMHEEVEETESDAGAEVLDLAAELEDWKEEGCLGLDADSDFFENDEAELDIEFNMTKDLWDRVKADPKAFVDFIDATLKAALLS